MLKKTIIKKERTLAAMPSLMRVAAYARVSSGKDEMLHSLAAQVSHYSDYIQKHPGWVYVGVYSDEGISAVNTKKRDGFNRMVADALAGKIDLIVTKSVSRFARNTVDSLTTVRNLKEKGVEVFFEKENIYTFDGKGELLITIMSSLAQEESRSISENVTWGQRKRFSDGKVSMPYKRFLGYEKGEDGTPKIVESEAEIVRMIYRLFMEGKTSSAIAKSLTESDIPSPGGKKRWQVATVDSILTNEKYKGDALLQKRFTVDFLSKKMKDNEGEVPQYYVQNSHPAIIDPDEFDAVQVEYERRKNLGRPNACQSPLSAKLVCGDCGGYFGSKVWNSNNKYRRLIWRCNEKYNCDQKCTTLHVTEEEVMEKFVDAFNSIMIYRDELIANCRLAQQVLCDYTSIDTELENLHREIEVITELSRKAISENAHGGLTAEEFNERYSGYQQRYHTAMERIAKLDEQKSEKQHKRMVLDIFIKNLAAKKHALDSFNNKIWMATIDRVLVSKTGQLTFRFKDGTEISR
jgi:DNA invertase Pin-like site-specific DNA recombinase